MLVRDVESTVDVEASKAGLPDERETLGQERDVRLAVKGQGLGVVGRSLRLVEWLRRAGKSTR